MALSLSDLFHSARYPLSPAVLLHMARFHSVLWPSQIPPHTRTAASSCAHLSVGTQAASVPWLLCVALQRTGEHMCPSDLGFRVSLYKHPEVGLLGPFLSLVCPLF